MRQKDKEILLKDLCMRIPYRTFVCLNPGAYNKPETCILTGVHGEKVYLNVDSDPFRIDNIKPYLRSMSSMTEKEREYLKQNVNRHFVDYCNEHHLDNNWLIDDGLALEAPEDMYKTE